ncbi:MAG TPA: hypothetical protein VGC93_08385 [Thermoanaerobaculia bacterium]
MRRQRGRREVWGALALAGAGTLAAAAGHLAGEAAARAQKVPAFTGEVQVQELGLVFEPPPRRALLEVPSFAPGDLLVQEDGLLRRVTRVDDEGETAGGWSLVVWIDRTLAGPETLFAAPLALAKEARRLAALGTVEVVVADPGPRTLLAPTREARLIEQVLADFAGAARVERDRSAAAGRKPRARDLPPPAVRRQCDRLLARVAGRRDPGPHALLWVADGGDEPALRETGRLLAAYRWVTLPLPLQRIDVGEPTRPWSDTDRRREGLDTGSNDATVPPSGPPPFTIGLRRRGGVSSLEAVAGLAVAPDLAPLRALVEETAGHLVGFEAQLAPALDALADRRQLWIERPAGRPASELHRLEATTIAGRPLRTFRWSRTATPPALAEARLRALLADGPGRDPLPAALARAPAPLLELDLGRFRPATAPAGTEGRAPRLLRLSLAVAVGEEPVSVRHEVVDAAALARGGWRHTVTLPAATEAGKLAVVVEDLAAESWAGAVVYL